MTPLALSVFASTLLSAPSDPLTEQPVVLAKGDEFIVHALGRAAGFVAVFGRNRRWPCTSCTPHFPQRS